MSWKDESNDNETQPALTQQQSITELQELHRTMKELRNYQGTQVQLQGTQDTAINQNLMQIQQTTDKTVAEFEKVIAALESNQELNRKNLVSQLRNSLSEFQDQTNKTTSDLIKQMQEIQTAMSANNSNLSLIHESLDKNVNDTLAQVSNRLEQEFKTTSYRISHMTLKGYLIAVIPFGIVMGVVSWLLNHFWG